MKKVFLFLFLLFFSVADKAMALPTCMPVQGESKFISRWQKTDDVWLFSFTCDDDRKAKIYADGVVDPSDVAAGFLILDKDGVPESQDVFDTPCEAIKAYCTNTLNLLTPEMKEELLQILSED